MTPQFNASALKDQLAQGNKITRGAERESLGMFDIKKPHNLNEKGIYETNLRMVVVNGTNGFTHRIIHQNVGVQGNDPKTFSCGRKFAKDCEICNTLELINENPTLAASEIPWVQYNSDRTALVKRPTRVDVIAKAIKPTNLLLFLVVQGEHYNNLESPEEVRGVQKWWCSKVSVINKYEQLMSRYKSKPGYFADPTSGHAVRLTYDPKANAFNMYNLTEGPVIPIDPSLCDKSPDPELWAPKLRGNDEINPKLKEMFPMLDY